MGSKRIPAEQLGMRIMVMMGQLIPAVFSCGLLSAAQSLYSMRPYQPVPQDHGFSILGAGTEQSQPRAEGDRLGSFPAHEPCAYTRPQAQFASTPALGMYPVILYTHAQRLTLDCCFGTPLQSGESQFHQHDVTYKRFISGVQLNVRPWLVWYNSPSRIETMSVQENASLGDRCSNWPKCC
jgi:hypothetical protein